MRAWLLAVLLDKPDLVELPPFTSNTVWTAPFNVGQLAKVIGEGQDGTPKVEGNWGYTEVYTVTIDGKLSQESFLPPVYDQLPPEDYCETVSPGRVECHTYTLFDERSDATTGESATAFGKTFPGGVAGPASPVTFGNVPIIPNQSYLLSIPPGGSITISYYR